MIRSIRNVFTKEECETFLTLGKNIGFAPAKCVYSDGSKNEIDTGIRDSQRCEYTSQELTNMFFGRFSGRFGYFTGINKSVRFLQYYPGQKFDNHYDTIQTSNKEYTFIIYLSDCIGGETIIQDQKISAEIGKVVIFDKSLPHSAEKVIQGVKYVIVGDLYTTNKKAHPDIDIRRMRN